MIINPVTQWFKTTQYNDKEQYIVKTQLKLHECIYTLEQ